MSHVLCGREECGIAYAAKERARADRDAAKVERVKDRARREAMKTPKEWKAQALAAFCAWIRKRDEDKPCISCGCMDAGQYHGGHYRDTFHYAALAFDEDNCHRQCAQCNAPPPLGMGGNLINYRMGLVERIGVDRVAALEQPLRPKKWTIEELKAIKEKYCGRLGGEDSGND